MTARDVSALLVLLLALALAVAVTRSSVPLAAGIRWCLMLLALCAGLLAIWHKWVL
jgi:hypothetical protein